MSEQPMLWLIPGLPLIGAILAGFLGPKFLRTKSHWPVVLAVAGSFVVTCVYALAPMIGHEPSVSRITAPSMVWFQAGNLSVEWAIAVDPLTATMLTPSFSPAGDIVLSLSGQPSWLDVITS